MFELINDILRSFEADRDAELTVPLCRPDVRTVQELADTLQSILFPGFFRRDPGCASLESYVTDRVCHGAFLLEGQLLPLICAHTENARERTRAICREFLGRIPQILRSLQLDLDAFLAGDPAAQSREEIIVSYPGYYAICIYRLANTLYRQGVPLLPRMLTELSHSKTGIDIHPGAAIGPSFFIDHGTGVVIGQTARIGAHVKLYQGVTLGALSTRGGQSLQNQKRHPTIEDGVTIYAGATILGGDTVIGQGATIGANAFITRSVIPGAKVDGRE